MTKEDVIRLAREADWPDSMVHPIIMAKLADFAKLVAEHEREACAKECDEIAKANDLHDGAYWSAKAIRARGQT